ncbi:MAG: hypothetical protein Sv326_0717 [Candidatus Fermentimicrarchaeum limneticum]|uniref:Uncharacterized protein n=1 Tax=Fermentimicrarchaeum limneticum TaxID=2795018 RepID=A0A7D5XHM0_FERL1|nr:MAG: hypothetical protein Sv326_0717 [Candidatus Fermentimicrarchaeum limneticum]
MVCYTIPTITAVVLHFIRGKKPSWKDSQKYKSLNLLLFGGAIFGIVDHIWNGELFLVGPNILSDLLLGFAITLTIVGVWGVTIYLEAISQKETSKAAN